MTTRQAVLSTLVLLVLTCSSFAQAAATFLPEPPKENPHPAITEADKKRVAFAEEAVSLLLKQPLPKEVSKLSLPASLPPFQRKDLNCLKCVSCYAKDTSAVSELITLQKEHGTILEIRHAHVIPWSYEQFQRNQAASTAKTKMSVDNSRRKRELKDTALSMRVPKLQPDEYMVHLYARLSETYRWYHVDVILSEDEKGQIFLRHFFVLEMPTNESQLPPGVRC